MSRAVTVPLADLDQAGLDHLRKLLDLTPRGRLTDDEDEEFGHRHVPGVGSLTLWRDPWRLVVSWQDVEPPDELLAEVRSAAAGHTTLPQHHTLTVRFTTALSVDQRELVRRILNLRREGVDAGWRYLRRDRDGVVLLRLSGSEVTVCHDGRPPDLGVVAACRVQLAAAAVKAGLVADVVAPDWEQVNGLVRRARTLADLWHGDEAHEVRRAQVIVAIMSSAWAEVPESVRCAARDFLLGISSDRPTSLGLNDRWLAGP